MKKFLKVFFMVILILLAIPTVITACGMVTIGFFG